MSSDSLALWARPALESFLRPWYQSVSTPHQAQEDTLARLLQGYRQTAYGTERGADQVGTVAEYRHSFPVVTFPQLKPYIEEVMAGNHRALIPEPPVEWAMTRGTTGESKYAPLTATDIDQRVACGARALLNYVYRNERYDILEGWDLNLNFPSVAGSMVVAGREITYGYSSGIYARHNAQRAQVKMVPSQEEVDALGGGISPQDWERRFELASTLARDRDVTAVIGVTQTMLHFASYMKRRWHVYPREVWDIDLLICTSIAGIHAKYKPALRALYGDVAIAEIYGATEGLYGQQLDDRPCVVPNYDTYFFEVQTRGGIKMLHELGRHHYGTLIVSSCLFPRYRIGDLIMCMGNGYFCVIGRERPLALARYLLDTAFR
ncbi:MAG: GH3 auxin-responsive promoter family protein [Chloroflexota bacterium]|nr:GH3 auxin-responsive promoter family protein [Chloroflexota bacterium]